jgi:endonuclease/exonuclease/phosphatase family metal-dependent hydrolase
MKDRSNLIATLTLLPEPAFDKAAQALRSLVELQDAVDAYLNPSTPLRVVHWNLHHGGVRVNTSTGKDLLPVDVANITNWLVKFNPDVVSLNELEQFDGYGQMDQLEHHRAALEAAQGVPWYSCFCQMSGGSKNAGGGIGLLSKWPLDNPFRKSLGDGRPMMMVQQPFGALCTAHPTSTSSALRTDEIKVITSQSIGTPAIFCGDFNAVPTASELKPMMTSFFDAWVEAAKISKATSFQSNGITHGVHRIDYIWFRGLQVLSVEVPDTRAGSIYPSDHHPVIATFQR